MASCVTSDCTKFVSGSEDKTAIIWDVQTGASLHRLVQHAGTVRGLTLTKDDMFLISISYDNKIKIWSMKTGQCLTTLRSHQRDGTSVVLNSDDSKLFSGSVDMTVKEWCKNHLLLKIDFVYLEGAATPVYVGKFFTNS